MTPNEEKYLLLRAGCCETWPKPCGYHEGWIDGYEQSLTEIEGLRSDVQMLGRAFADD